MTPAELRARLDLPRPYPLVRVTYPRPGQRLLCAVCSRFQPIEDVLAALGDRPGTYLCKGCLKQAADIPRGEGL